MSPDSGAVLDGFDDDVVFTFNEVLQEQGLENLVTISPRPDEVRVSWHRTRIAVRPREGWRDGITYHVTLLPGVTDLRTNRMEEGVEVVFSTGGPIPDTHITGYALDWEGYRPAPGALIEAIRPSDSLTFVTRADSTSAFQLAALPPGPFLLLATVDQNRNNRRDSREAFDSVSVSLDSALDHVFWMFPHDTLGPRIRTLTRLDSVAVGVEFTQVLALAPPEPGDVRVLELPDSTPVPVTHILWPATYDSLQAARRDSLAALVDTVSIDSLAADTLAVDTLPTPAEAGAAEPEPQDTSVVARLLATRPPPQRQIVIQLGAPLKPGTRYAVETTVRNLLDAVATSNRSLAVPAPRDST